MTDKTWMIIGVSACIVALVAIGLIFRSMGQVNGSGQKVIPKE